MKLDSRIIEGKKPLNCFDTEQAKQFLGKECYFSDQLCTFNKLLDAYSYVTVDMLVSKEKHLYVGELLTVGDSDGSCYEAGINGEAEWFQFCLPCEWVKEPEKKYRPFSLEEFLKIFDVGDQIGFRSKDNGEVKYAMFVGYTDGFFADNTDKIDGENDVMIGIYRYSFSYLFENYDLYFEDEWQPFGVIDEDKE